MCKWICWSHTLASLTAMCSVLQSLLIHPYLPQRDPAQPHHRIRIRIWNILSFGSKWHKMSKNRNTLIILRTYIVPKIAQKANIKNRECCLSDCSVGSWVQNIATQKCTFISQTASSALWFTTLKIYPNPKKEIKGPTCMKKSRSKGSCIEVFWCWIFIRNKVKYC